MITAQKNAPPTADEERAKLAEHEQALERAGRALKSAQAARAQHRARGDMIAEEDRRKEIRHLEKVISELTLEIDSDREDLEAALKRERAAKGERAISAIAFESAKFKESLEALDDSIAAFGTALLAALKQQDSLEATIRSAGGTVDIDSVHSKLLGLVEQNLYLATNGMFGELRSLYTPTEIRKYNQASLKRLARQHHELTLRQARAALGFTDEPPPEAA